MVNFVTARQHSRLMFLTRIAAVASTNNLLTELKSQSVGEGKGGAKKHCQPYQAGGMAKRRLRGDVLCCFFNMLLKRVSTCVSTCCYVGAFFMLPLLFLSDCWELPTWCCQPF